MTSGICEECGLSIAECNECAIMRIEDDKSARMERQKTRIADLEAENTRLMSVMSDVGHLAGSLGSCADGWLRGRFMSISNALNAAIGRAQSSHGDQFDAAGNVVKPDQRT